MIENSDELIPTRQTLLSRLKDWQDQASWREFFDTYWRLLYGVALKAGLTEAEAQDVVQETMLAAARNMPGFTYGPPRSLPQETEELGWLRGVGWAKELDAVGKGDRFGRQPRSGQSGRAQQLAGNPRCSVSLQFQSGHPP
jgi:DNA-directed RNA polymerase specialized sigma24 family protein